MKHFARAAGHNTLAEPALGAPHCALQTCGHHLVSDCYWEMLEPSKWRSRGSPALLTHPLVPSELLAVQQAKNNPLLASPCWLVLLTLSFLCLAVLSGISFSITFPAAQWSYLACSSPDVPPCPGSQEWELLSLSALKHLLSTAFHCSC